MPALIIHDRSQLLVKQRGHREPQGIFRIRLQIDFLNVLGAVDGIGVASVNFGSELPSVVSEMIVPSQRTSTQDPYENVCTCSQDSHIDHVF
jgi:hypothetical protein